MENQSLEHQVKNIIMENLIKTIENNDKIKKINNTIISIPIDPPGKIGQDCIKLSFNINDNCQLEIEGIDLRNNNSITNHNLGVIR